MFGAQGLDIAVFTADEIACADGGVQVADIPGAKGNQVNHGLIGNVAVVHGDAGEGQPRMVAVQDHHGHGQCRKLHDFLTAHFSGQHQQAVAGVAAQLCKHVGIVLLGNGTEEDGISGSPGIGPHRVDDGVHKAVVFVCQQGGMKELQQADLLFQPAGLLGRRHIASGNDIFFIGIPVFLQFHLNMAAGKGADPGLPERTMDTVAGET